MERLRRGAVRPRRRHHADGRACTCMPGRRCSAPSSPSRGIDEPYTDDDYFTYVDGKPRYDGVRSFLASRGIELPEGDPTDAPAEQTVSGLGNRKNEVFEEVLRREGVEAYPGSRRLVEALVGAGHRAGGRVELAQRAGRAAGRGHDRLLPDHRRRPRGRRAPPRRQARARHVPVRGRAARRRAVARGRARGRAERRRRRRGGSISAWWSASTAVSAPRRSPRTAPTRSSPTSRSCCELT